MLGPTVKIFSSSDINNWSTKKGDSSCSRLNQCFAFVNLLIYTNCIHKLFVHWMSFALFRCKFAFLVFMFFSQCFCLKNYGLGKVILLTIFSMESWNHYQHNHETENRDSFTFLFSGWFMTAAERIDGCLVKIWKGGFAKKPRSTPQKIYFILHRHWAVSRSTKTN